MGACEFGHLPVMVTLLSDARVDPNFVTQQDIESALMYAAANGQNKAVQLLLTDKRVNRDLKNITD